MGSHMTTIQHAYFLFCLLVIDLLTIRLIRKLLRDFLRSKKNKHAINILHNSQPLKNRITLDYIYPLLKHNQKAFRGYRRLYLIVVLSEIPQFIVVLLLYLFLADYAIIAVLAFAGIKIIVYVIVRANFDANMVSIYRK